MVLSQRQHTGRARLKECAGFKMAANGPCKSLDMGQTESEAVARFVPNPTAANTCIVMVTYNPGAGLDARINNIRRQVDSFVIVDNDSEAEGLALLGVICDDANIFLIQNNENQGIAAALNRGISWAIRAGYSWVLLLDQDTVPSPGMLNGLLTTYNDCPMRDEVAIVGSNYIEAAGRQGTPLQLTPSPSWAETPVVITAGSLLSLDAFRVIGPFRVEYFIDCVDMEYCLRARSKGFKVIVATIPLMAHKIGQPTRYQLPWRVLALSNHSPMRRYYMVRNHVDLAKKFLVSEPSYVLSSLWARLKSTILVCLLEDDRLLKAWYASLGLFDGIFCIFDRKLS